MISLKKHTYGQSPNRQEEYRGSAKKKKTIQSIN